MRLKYGKFFSRWRDSIGIDHRRGFNTKREAEKYQERMKAEARAQKLVGTNTIRNLCQAWLEAHSKFQDRRDRWASRFCHDELISVAGESKVHELHWFIPNALLDKWDKQDKYAVATMFTLRFRLKNLLTWLVEHGGSPELVKKLQKAKIPQARQIIAEAWEIESIKASSPPWFKCFVLFCLDGGLRTAEALRICPANYSAGTGQFTIEVKKRRVKNFHASEELKALLEMSPVSSEPSIPFVTLLRGEPTGDKQIYPYFKNLLKRIGSEARMVNGKLTWLHPHDLRRTIATWMYWKTKNIRQVQEYLGHAHAITTLRYIVHANTAEILPILEDLKIERRHEAVVQIMKRKGAGA
ncbi:MAG: tyrosine-type recombinase/integrase [Candidatus Dormibacteraceae bacterium]